MIILLLYAEVSGANVPPSMCVCVSGEDGAGSFLNPHEPDTPVLPPPSLRQLLVDAND